MDNDTPEKKPDNLRTIRPKKCIVRWSLKKIIEAADQRTMEPTKNRGAIMKIDWRRYAEDRVRKTEISGHT